jgi:YidC/Oxa1 family membrane protein insertase
MTLAVVPVIKQLVDFNQGILRFFHDSLGFGWGAAIIGLTVTIRLLILPLTFKGVRSMQAMQRLQPEIKRIQERYKEDKQRQQQEMMRFYQEHKVNPLGSCLPLALQMPFFISLYQLLRSPSFKADIQGAEKFLFIPNLAKPVTGHPAILITLLVLYIVTQLGASLVTAISADRTQRMIMLGFPLFFGFIIIRFQAGLIVYWITTNVWTIGQQLAVKRLFPPPEPLPEGAAFAKDRPAAPAAAEAGGKRSFFERIMEAASQREEPKGASADGPDGRGDARPAGRTASRTATRARSAEDTDGGGGARKPPPPSPRRKKKRSGRRR